VTAVLPDVAAPPVPAVAARLRALPWLLASAVLVVALLRTGTPAVDISRYALYLVFGVALPGTLVHRALRGSRGNLPEDIGFGAATGLLVLLAGWALTAATGLQALLIGWPALVVALFLAVPGLRRHWRIADPEPLPLSWSWIVAAALILLVAVSWPAWARNPLPPAGAVYYQDLMYHLALVHEMTRSMPFQVPQLTGDTLRYTYLSDADMAAGSMITGVAPVTVLLRLWFVPIAAVTVLVTAALTREITGKWWAGALAGATGMLSLPLAMGAVAPFGVTPINFDSPSLTYAFPLLGLLLALAVDVLRGRPLRWAWLIVLPLALACAGAKSSALPPLVAGLLLAVVAVFRVDRARWRPALAFLGLVLAAMLAGLKLFAGGGAGTLAVLPGATLKWFRPARETLGGDVFDGHSSLVGVLGFAAVLVLWWVLVQSPRLLGLLAVVAPGTRRDPVVWLLSGLTVAGVGGLWVLSHPSASQVYFYSTVIPFGTMLTVWFLAGQARSRRPVVAGLVAGAVWAFVLRRPAPPADPSFLSWSWALIWPILLTAVVVAIGLALWRFRTGRLAWRAVPVALTAAVLAGGLATQVDQRFFGPPPAPRQADLAILPGEAAAAVWLDAHAGRDDVVATNVHCGPIDPVGDCDARAFWVAGLAGRRTVVESWGYTDQAVARDGEGGRRYFEQPAPYPDRYALNQRVFAEGRAADVAEMRRQFRARWLFADSRAPGGVSPLLAQVARVAYIAGPVTVYDIR
jgi:hypothetical protein